MEKNPQLQKKIFLSEHTIQQECIAWFRNEYERFGKGIIIPIPNELAAKRKDISIKKGCSDLIIVFNRKVLFIELKTSYNTQSNDQIKFQNEVNSLGYEYHLIRSLEQFKNLIYDLQRPLPKL